MPITAAEWRPRPGGLPGGGAGLQYPLFVKPARGGSSLGISKVDDVATLERAIELAQRHDPKVIVEQGFVGARELECGVLADLDGGPPQGQRGGRDPGAQRIRLLRLRGQVPARGAGRPRRAGRCRPELAEQVRALAVRTFEAIGCEGLARVDVFVTHDDRC